MTDFVDETIHRCKAEKSILPIAHLQRQGLLTDDVWARLDDGIKINARSPGEFTALNHAHRRKFYEEVCAICQSRGWKGDAARERVAREIHPRYATLPDSDKNPFALTRAIHIAKRGLGTVRKSPKMEN
jgi:hypothetical protein